MATGKLIAFEGTDGSGKGTQMGLLIEELKKRNIPYETLDFPQYGKTLFGDLAGRMLKGDFGGVHDIPPELAVLPYACDRWSIKEQLKTWLSEGKMVISNRYTASSAVYQAAKLSVEKQYPFVDWVYKLEQEVIGLPPEDLVFYFHVPVVHSQELIKKKEARAYLGDKKDIYEENISIQETVERLYIELATHKRNWKTIECMDAETLRSREEIHKDVLDVLTQNAIL
jgi:dTMP kinase